MKSSQKRNRQISRRDNRRPEKAILHVQFENHRTVRLCSFLKNAVFRFAALQVFFELKMKRLFQAQTQISLLTKVWRLCAEDACKKCASLAGEKA